MNWPDFSDDAREVILTMLQDELDMVASHYERAVQRDLPAHKQRMQALFMALMWATKALRGNDLSGAGEVPSAPEHVEYVVYQLIGRSVSRHPQRCGALGLYAMEKRLRHVSEAYIAAAEFLGWNNATATYCLAE